MTIQDALKHSVATLKKSGIPTARLDALVLLEDVLGQEKAWLLAHSENELTSQQVNKLASFLKRRVKHEPLAYIRGKSEFYGREFLVTPATLQPRAETETMIDSLKNLIAQIQNPKSQKPYLLEVKPHTDKEVILVDVGTGSGCLAITAKLEFPKAEVYATEINKDALAIARKNASKLEADIHFLEGNLMEPIFPLHSPPLVLLCNLPYVPNGHTINQAAMQEPEIAIFGGLDGLVLYRELFAQIKQGPVGKPELILTESLPFQHEALAAIAHEHSYKQITEEDFIQVFTLL
jgi:release factor glutamine methyltransferase